MAKKILIVGGGVAGLCLAIELERKGHEVNIIDDDQNVSSTVAAGLVNPFSFRRTLLSWKANPFFWESEQFYLTLQQSITEQFYHKIFIRRLFANQEEATLWQSRLSEAEYDSFMLPLTGEDMAFSSFGSGRVKGFWIDVKVFIPQVKAYFNEKGLVKKALFDFSLFNPSTLKYSNEKYDSVVFVTGFRNHENPLFINAPINATKGQLLTANWNNPETKTSLHRKAFALPLGEKLFKIGSTYEWNNTNIEITPEAQSQILRNFQSISNDPVEVIHQESGIRPTTPDRRPIVGRHQTYHDVYIFNGLGTKGYMLAPSLANHLAEAITNNSPLSEELSPDRFNR